MGCVARLSCSLPLDVCGTLGQDHFSDICASGFVHFDFMFVLPLVLLAYPIAGWFYLYMHHLSFYFVAVFCLFSAVIYKYGLSWKI